MNETIKGQNADAMAPDAADFFQPRLPTGKWLDLRQLQAVLRGFHVTALNTRPLQHLSDVVKTNLYHQAGLHRHADNVIVGVTIGDFLNSEFQHDAFSVFHTVVEISIDGIYFVCERKTQMENSEKNTLLCRLCEMLTLDPPAKSPFDEVTYNDPVNELVLSMM